MTQEEKNIKLIEKEIKKIENKKNKIMFFVMDTKGAPIGSLAYIYETAYQLKEMGYNVQMLHDEKDFVGVEAWLGEKYANLPHKNINSNEISVSPSDILFIPELYANIMAHVKELPCKKVAILQNLNYLTDFIKPGVTWGNLKIRDCVTTSEFLKKRIAEYFPYVNTRVVRPSIMPSLEKPIDGRDLIINIIAKDKKDVDSIVKPFYWKYPSLSWVTFREIKNLPREEFPKYLSEGVATIWCDTDTCFGYSALEAMAQGNIVIGKIPENEVEWLYDKEGNLKPNGVWFNKYSEAIEYIYYFINSFLSDDFSSDDEIYNTMSETVKEYTLEGQIKDIEREYVDGLFVEHEKILKTYLGIVNNVQKD